MESEKREKATEKQVYYLKLLTCKLPTSSFFNSIGRGLREVELTREEASLAINGLRQSPATIERMIELGGYPCSPVLRKIYQAGKEGKDDTGGKKTARR